MRRLLFSRCFKHTYGPAQFGASLYDNLPLCEVLTNSLHPTGKYEDFALMSWEDLYLSKADDRKSAEALRTLSASFNLYATSLDSLYS